jgi:hypothetical protein
MRGFFSIGVFAEPAQNVHMHKNSPEMHVVLSRVFYKYAYLLYLYTPTMLFSVKISP